MRVYLHLHPRMLGETNETQIAGLRFKLLNAMSNLISNLKLAILFLTLQQHDARYFVTHSSLKK